MSKRTQWNLAVLALATGLAIGFALGRTVPSSGGDPLPTAGSSPVPAADPAAAPVYPAGDPGEVVTVRLRRPFAPGGAEEWIRSLARRVTGRMTSLWEMPDLMTEFAALDVDGLREAVEAWDSASLPFTGDPNDSSDIYSMFRMMLHREWGKRDPEDAMAYIRDLADERRRHDLMHPAMAGWTMADPDAALRALRAMPEGRERELAERGVMEALAAVSPERTLLVAAEFRERKPDEEVLTAVADAAVRLAIADPVRAATLAARAPGDPDRERRDPLARVLRMWTLKDPEAVAAWADSYEGPDKPRVLVAFLAQDVSSHYERIERELPELAATDPDSGAMARLAGDAVRTRMQQESPPAETAAWVDALPEGAVRLTARHALAQSWIAADEVAASEWIAGLPPGPDRDRCALSLIESIEKTDPAAALAWAQSLDAPETRQKRIEQILETLEKSDPEAAAAARAERERR